VKIKVCHLTSVHPAYDIRIFSKECQSLAKAGYDVVLIARHDRNETINGVRIIPFPRIKNRFARMLFAPLRMFFLALNQGAKLYHFHDPELICTGLLLRLFTRAKVIYDIHEDFKTSIRQKYYLPRGLAVVIAGLFGFFEVAASKCFTLVLAEKYYKERFPRGIHLLNYPIAAEERWKDSVTGGDSSLPGVSNKPLPEVSTPGNHCLLYTGIIAEERGALLHAEILTYLETVDLYMVGFCRASLAQRIKQRAGQAQNALHLEGEAEFVRPARIHHYYKKGKWLAGLAIFPPTSHYMKKELTKFFEYMSAGIPIICSDFPVWRELVEGTGAGVVVNPFDQQAIANAVTLLAAYPDKAEKMGENGKRAVFEHYNWAVEEKKLIDLYQALSSPKSPADYDPPDHLATH
jgi:glycosyltransferase involved in cell wall biosynthesis